METYTAIDHRTYVVLSARTLGNKFYAEFGKPLISNDRIDGLHGAIGMVTEVQELMIAILKPTPDIVNVGEEIADCFFYTTIFERIFDFSLSNPQIGLGVIGPRDLLVDLVIDTGEVLDYYKKAFFYDRQLERTKIISRLKSITERLETLAVCYGLDTNELKAKNINKLRARFPDRFTEEKANNRDLNKEYETLK